MISSKKVYIFFWLWRWAAHLIKAVPEDGQGLVAEQPHKARQVVQLLVGTDADAQAPDGAHAILRTSKNNN